MATLSAWSASAAAGTDVGRRRRYRWARSGPDHERAVGHVDDGAGPTREPAHERVVRERAGRVHAAADDLVHRVRVHDVDPLERR